MVCDSGAQGAKRQDLSKMTCDLCKEVSVRIRKSLVCGNLHIGKRSLVGMHMN